MQFIQKFSSQSYFCWRHCPRWEYWCISLLIG
ncbi:hypothetical protein F0726_01824 [Acidithiobacillus caldus]|nr:hypothetical protein F0726_01824 [Acidithiobacillus caldus]